jgi:hypothetical protein
VKSAALFACDPFLLCELLFTRGHAGNSPIFRSLIDAAKTKQMPTITPSDINEFVKNGTVENPGLGSHTVQDLSRPILRPDHRTIDKMLHFAYSSPRSRVVLTETQTANLINSEHNCDKASQAVISQEGMFSRYDDSTRIWSQQNMCPLRGL